VRPGARAGVASSAGMAKALISQSQKASLTGTSFRRFRYRLILMGGSLTKADVKSAD
jgi:hypothetical protein